MFTLADLPYAYNALEPFIDEETMHIHHDKHHAAYIKNLNDALSGHKELLKLSVEEILKDLSVIPEVVRTKVRNNAGGHYNHTLFWGIMGKSQDAKPVGEVAAAINESFGSFDSFKEKFAVAATGRFGSGWAWLSVSGGKLIIEDTPNQDCPISSGRTPILGLDVWEHAYYLKYQNRRPDYINAWWNVVNWEAVDKNFVDCI